MQDLLLSRRALQSLLATGLLSACATPRVGTATDRSPDKDAVAIVSFSRPRAYFGLPRDVVLINGEPT